MSAPRKSKEKNRKKRYHHGDLRRALIETSLALIEKDGVGALTLREVARRLGVSHAAPKHHFADKAALLAALAAQGFSQLADAMILAAEQAGDEPMRRLNATGVTYVVCAVRQPQKFRLMFGSEIPELMSDDADLLKEQKRALAVLKNEHDIETTELSDEADLLKQRARAFAVFTNEINRVMAFRGESDLRQALVYVAGAWAIVHGLATLWIDGRFEFVQDQFSTAESLARAVTDLMYKLFEKA